MPSPFTSILEGRAPGRILWRDERCFALLANEPLEPGHSLVVPRQEVDHWIDLEPELAAHVFVVAQRIGRALQRELEPRKIGLSIAGLLVRHAHLHLVPIDEVADLDLTRAPQHPAAEALDELAERIRRSL